MDTAKLDKKFLVHPEDPSLEITRAEGSYIVDAGGKRYIDFVMGWCVGNLGWGNHRIENAIRFHTGPAYASPTFTYRPAAELAELLAKIAPGKLRKVFRATGGSEAVDIALQLAMIHTGRKKFISIEGCYHGNTVAARSVSKTEDRDAIPHALSGCHKIKPPLDEKKLQQVETLLKKRDVAAFIMEPVLTHPHLTIPEAAFMRGLQKLCRKYGTLLIMDEIACGFGRMGKLFATEHYRLEPDILCMAKALTGGYAAMGATIVTEEVAESAGETDFYSTFGWHPISVAAGLANVKYLVEHKEQILKNVEAVGEYMEERFSDMYFRKPVFVERVGLFISVDVGSSEYATLLKHKCQKAGLLIATQDKFLVLMPALNIDMNTAHKGLDILAGCAQDSLSASKRKAVEKSPAFLFY